ncbi:sulfatase [Fulvitalea axinellae]
MKKSYLCLGLALWSLLASCEEKKKEKPKRPPNIVIVYADDMGWADAGFNNVRAFYETPNLDRLASEGLNLRRFYPSAANCAPSRACMLTGTFTPRHGVYIPQGLSRGGSVEQMRFKVPARGADSTFNTFPVSVNQVPASFTSLAELLRQKGYASARFGKWHIGDDNQGFGVNSANGELGQITNRHGKEARYYGDTLVAERLTEASVNFMRENKDRPFFLYLAHWEVHAPNAARKGRIAYYRKKAEEQGRTDINPVYAAEVEQIDRSVGRISEALAELGLEENTLLIFTSDNGGVSANTSNLPLRAGKGTFYEGGIRTPCVMRWKGVTKPGSVSEQPVNGVDFMPTFAELSGAPLPESQPVDGESIVPLLRGKDYKRKKSMFFHFPLYLGTGNSDKVLPSYKGKSAYWRSVPCSVLIWDDWKLIYYYEYDRHELYKLSEDISEKNNLWNKDREKAQEMLAEMRRWVVETDAPVPLVENI